MNLIKFLESVIKDIIEKALEHIEEDKNEV